MNLANRPRRFHASIAIALSLTVWFLTLIELPVAASYPSALALAPTTWQFSPTGWTAQPVAIARISDADGLQPSSCEFRSSTDGGNVWSPWRADGGLQASALDANTVQVTVTVPSMVDSISSNQVQYRIIDGGSTRETSPAQIVQVDRQAPVSVSDLSVEPAGWTDVNSFDLSWSNPPQTLAPISRAYYKLGSAPLGVGDYDGYADGPGIASLADVSAPASGSIACYVWLGDAAGNYDLASAVSVTLYYAGDGAPLPPQQVSIEPASWDLHCRYAVSWSNPATSSGVQAVWYKWQSLPAADDDGTRVAGEDIDELVDLHAPGQGATPLYLWLEDTLGRKDHARHAMVQALCDAIAPETTVLLAPPLPVGGWYSDTVTVTMVADDGGLSGVAETRWRHSQTPTWSTENPFAVDEGSRIEYQSVDVAGNLENLAAVDVNIDRQDPVSAVQAAPPGPSGWYTGTVQATLEVSDAESGPAGAWYRVGDGPWTRGADLQVSGNGSHVVEYYAVDVAGNTETIHSWELSIDDTPPTVSAEADKMGAFVQPPVLITIRAVDPTTGEGQPLSGVARIEYRRQGDRVWTEGFQIHVASAAGDGTHVFQYRAWDGAGNVSAIGEIGVTVDGTPPTVGVHDIQGLEGCNGYYRGPIDVTLAATDGLSGVASMVYRDNQGNWVTTEGAPATLRLTKEGRHIVQYQATDAVGNQTEMAVSTLYIDSQAPVSPTAISSEPSGWSSSDGFTVCWQNPAEDASSARISAAYYKVGSPPLADDDGVRVDGSDINCLTDVSVGQDGEHDIYVWLEDGACNANHLSARAVTVLLDSTAPNVSVAAAGTLGDAGYYVSSVEVTLSSADAMAGLAETRYRVNSGEWREWSGTPIVLSTEGEHTVEYQASDKAGNESTVQQAQYRIDLQHPKGYVWTDSTRVVAPSVTVHWRGTDAVAGIAGYTIEYRIGGCAAWQTWRTIETPLSGSAELGGLAPNSFIYFRIRTRDRAGHESVSDGHTYAYYEGLGNPGFDSGALGAWASSGDLPAEVVSYTAPDGPSSSMALLGHKGGAADSLPFPAYAAISQRIQIPNTVCDHPLALSFWYRMFTYDVGLTEIEGGVEGELRWVDTFELTVRDILGNELELLLRDGYRGDNWAKGVLQDLGWQHVDYDLSQYAGQTVQLDFRVWNRVDGYWPTWVYLEDVQLNPRVCRLHLPLVVQSTSTNLAASGKGPTWSITPRHEMIGD